MTDAERWNIVVKLLGHVRDGSSAAVTIDQDDATESWVVRVGRRSYYGDRLDDALKAAQQGSG